MPLRTEHVQTGSRVSYEDASNPRRTGSVTEVILDGREFRVAWDEGGETVSDLRQHGWYQLAQLGPDNPFNDVEIISSYTVEDAINDGQLVPSTDLTPDEPMFTRQAGWTIPVVLTTAVANIVTPTEREAHDRCQDIKGRLWDLLNMGAMYGRGQQGDTIVFPCIFQLAGSDRVSAGLIKRNACAKTLHFKAVVGPDSDGDPICTIMLRNES